MADDYSIIANGTDLCELTGAHVVGFSQKMPEPKVITVDIPAGSDLDITDALGPIGYHNGHHTLEMLVTGETEQECVTRCREIAAMLHGNAMDYRLTWDANYTYHGRFRVEQERRNHLASIMTIDIDRSPWKKSTRESHVVDCHPYGWYDLEGSTRYHTVRAKFLQDGGGDVAVEEPLEYTTRTTGTRTLATDAYAGETVWLKVDSWVMYVDGDENLVVNSYSISGSNFVVNADYTVTDGDIYFADADKQKVTVDFYRWDV